MSGKKPNAEEFVRNVLAKCFKQTVDNETLREVANKVKEAVATKQKASPTHEAA